MKNVTSKIPLRILIVFAAFLTLSASAQQDTLYSINNTGPYFGITKYMKVDPDAGTIDSVSSFALGDGNTQSAAMGIDPTGKYLYYVRDANNAGDFTLYSISVDGSQSAGTPQFTADINGGGANNVYIRRIAVRKDGWAYMVNSEANTNVVYLSRFMTYPDGHADNFQSLGTVTLDGTAAPANFFNGDIAFDSNGSMWALVNEDVSGGQTYVYKMDADVLNSATSGGITNMQKRFVIKANAAGDNFPGLITGIAYSSKDNLFISIQDNNGGTDEGGIYFVANAQDNPQDQAKNIVVSKVSSLNGTGIADLASSYYANPDNNVLPVNFGTITAKISDNSLVVNWSTLKETNNSYFDVQTSTDGKNFVTIGSVNTKASDGNSDIAIQYVFTKSVDSAMSLAGISLLAFGCILLMLNRKNKFLMALVIFAGLGITVTSCSKSGSEIDASSSGKLFVRIVQYDKNGGSNKSDVIAAYKAD